MAHILIRVANEADWRTYHAIRRTVLWEDRGLSGYDETLAEERLPNHHPLLQIFKGRGIGTTRLDDLRDGTGIVRLVAIAAPDRGQGHGRILNAKVEECAHRLGIRVLLVNAAAAAEGFYIATGWRRLVGHLPLALGRAGNCIPMQKAIIVL
ncbi:GNAT family N-acetyltransferase (plasmid) [Methylobacterium sp. NMS14P]|uniref:GNAT family N-acetyltransferase n=1 Tax=Methylobacterium sp. NMS14P TaxID=2894310 RepID=UPI002359D179|nr:GNAT family N-acetyltransferase [Methylobacterium sp. NMS14P]WCS28902.1 GNAT family N-acetyltransferase [Methylobacterium sp. NMS14P]